MEKNYFITKDEYQTVKQTWTSVEEHPAWHHIIYNILRSKPSDLGFSEKKSHFQANDSWNGYNEPLREVRRVCSKVNPWAAQKGTSHDRMYLIGESTIVKNQKLFKEIFGIDMPEGLFELLGETK